MITKETARQIYNCHSQIEAIDHLKEEMLKEIERMRKADAESKEPIPEKDFGRFYGGCKLGVPEGSSTSWRIFGISPELAIKVIDEQREVFENRLASLKAIAMLEISKS